MNNWNLIYRQKMKELNAIKQLSDLEREIGRISYYIDALTEHCAKLITRQEKIKDEFGLQSWGESTDNAGQEGIDGCIRACETQDGSGTAQ